MKQHNIKKPFFFKRKKKPSGLIKENSKIVSISTESRSFEQNRFPANSLPLRPTVKHLNQHSLTFKVLFKARTRCSLSLTLSSLQRLMKEDLKSRLVLGCGAPVGDRLACLRWRYNISISSDGAPDETMSQEHYIPNYLQDYHTFWTMDFHDFSRSSQKNFFLYFYRDNF